MFFEFFFAILIAILLTAVFAAGFRRQNWGAALVFFFLILFLATWAGGMWVVPFGPIAWGVPWVTYLFVGIVIALLLTALIPPVERPTYPGREPGISEPSQRDNTAVIGLDIFMIVLMLALIIAIVAAYYA